MLIYSKEIALRTCNKLEHTLKDKFSETADVNTQEASTEVEGL